MNTQLTFQEVNQLLQKEYPSDRIIWHYFKSFNDGRKYNTLLITISKSLNCFYIMCMLDGVQHFFTLSLNSDSLNAIIETIKELQ